MSELSPSAPGKAGPPKKPVSPARNVIGLVVLVGVVVGGWFEYSAKSGYNAAVTALNQRLEDEDHGLPTMPEAEKLIGKEADNAGSEAQEGNMAFLKKTYTWQGIRSYMLAAYYTRGQEPALHHIEADKKFEPTPLPAAPGPGGLAGTPLSEASKGRQVTGPKSSPKAKAEAKAGADDKAKAGADDKAKAGADDKAKAPEPKTEEPPKAGDDDKAKAPAKAD